MKAREQRNADRPQHDVEPHDVRGQVHGGRVAIHGFHDGQADITRVGHGGQHAQHGPQAVFHPAAQEHIGQRAGQAQHHDAAAQHDHKAFEHFQGKFALRGHQHHGGPGDHQHRGVHALDHRVGKHAARAQQ